MKHPSAFSRQRGVMLLEALIGILVFSIGILALVGLQAVSVKHVSEAKYRSDAAFLANQIIAQMWADNPANLANYAHQTTTTATCTFSGGASANANVTGWLGATTTSGTVLGLLPGASTTKTQITVGAGNLVTVTICWQKPGEPVPHQYQAVAQING